MNSIENSSVAKKIPFLVMAAALFCLGFYMNDDSSFFSSSTSENNRSMNQPDNRSADQWQVAKRIRVCQDAKCTKMSKGVLKPGLVFQIVSVQPRSYLIELAKSKNRYYLLRRDYGRWVLRYNSSRFKETASQYGDHRFEEIGTAKISSLSLPDKNTSEKNTKEKNTDMKDGGASKESQASSFLWMLFLIGFLLLPGLNFSAIVGFYKTLYERSFRWSSPQLKLASDWIRSKAIGRDRSVTGFAETSDAYEVDESVAFDEEIADEPTGVLKVKNVFDRCKSVILNLVERVREPKYAAESELKVDDTEFSSAQGFTHSMAENKDSKSIDEITQLAETLLVHRTSNVTSKSVEKNTTSHSAETCVSANTSSIAESDNEKTAVIEFPDFQEFTDTGILCDPLDSTQEIELPEKAV